MAGAAPVDVGELMAGQLMKAAQVVEEQLDAEINRLENMDEDELEVLRQKRMAAMKKQQAKKQVWFGLVQELWPSPLEILVQA